MTTEQLLARLALVPLLADAAPPTASNVNFGAGETAANMAVVRAGAGGQIGVHHNSRGASELIVDQAGFFIAPLS